MQLYSLAERLADSDGGEVAFSFAHSLSKPWGQIGEDGGIQKSSSVRFGILRTVQKLTMSWRFEYIFYAGSVEAERLVNAWILPLHEESQG